MARPDDVERRLRAVYALRDGPVDGEALRAALGDRSNVVVASAAEVIAERAVDGAGDALADAFARFLDRPVQRDPGCRAKTAVARALHALDEPRDDVFTAGVRWVQLEPVWGGSEDTAAELRGVCGVALAHMAHPEAACYLAALLADPQRMARAAAAQGLGDLPGREGVPLLRYKAIVGDADPEVMVACFGSLLALAPDESLPFVASFLAGDAAESAALALGESRLEPAFPVLVEWLEAEPRAERRRVAFVALSLLRREPAVDYLLDVIRSRKRPLADAELAVRALAAFRHDDALRARVWAAVRSRRSRALTAAATTALGDEAP